MASSDLLKGMLKPIILKLLHEKGRMYGYEITQLMKEITNGEVALTFGALYPILHKLEKDGIVKTEQEVINNRNRIYYSISKKGASKAQEKIAELEEIVQTLKVFLKPNFGLHYESA
ncbi:MAG: PadR family transcriptional regulator [Bacteroidia bacterium]|jgi:DNA-binding PadR family transcriptional regulator